MQTNQLIDLCREMIRTQSYSGHEEGMVRIFSDFMRSHNFDEVFTDRYGNVLGCIRGKRPGKRILFDGHIDTVPAENKDAWSHDPFDPILRDGAIYGRGAADMKGADAAFLTAVAAFAEETDRDFAGEIWVAGIVHEECFEGIASRAVSKRVQPDVVIIGEASDCDLKISQRGRAEIILETFGIPCHSSNPEKGVNAVLAMNKAITAFETLQPPKQEGMVGDGIMTLTDIRSEPYPGASVVPHYCRVTYDRRLLPGETRESVLEPLRNILDRLSAQDPTFKAKVSFSEGSERCYTGETISADRFFPAWKESADDPLVQTVLSALHAAGLEPKLTGYSFCTNGSHYGGEAGIPCLGMGPGPENLAHTIDEHVSVEQLERARQSCLAICRGLLLSNKE